MTAGRQSSTGTTLPLLQATPLPLLQATPLPLLHATEGSNQKNPSLAVCVCVSRQGEKAVCWRRPGPSSGWARTSEAVFVCPASSTAYLAIKQLQVRERACCVCLYRSWFHTFLPPYGMMCAHTHIINTCSNVHLRARTHTTTHISWIIYTAIPLPRF